MGTLHEDLCTFVVPG